MKKFFNEFKTFILKGNVMNLAVGVIIGAAFQSIVNSLVNDIISPIIGLIAKTDLSDLYIVLAQKTEEIDGVVTTTDVMLKYGSFLTSVINFLIMAFVIFLMVKGINKITSVFTKHDEKPAKLSTKKCPFCFSEIDIKATRCPHCTSKIEAMEISEG